MPVDLPNRSSFTHRTPLLRSVSPLNERIRCSKKEVKLPPPADLMAAHKRIQELERGLQAVEAERDQVGEEVTYWKRFTFDLARYIELSLRRPYIGRVRQLANAFRFMVSAVAGIFTRKPEVDSFDLRPHVEQLFYEIRQQNLNVRVPYLFMAPQKLMNLTKGWKNPGRVRVQQEFSLVNKDILKSPRFLTYFIAKMFFFLASLKSFPINATIPHWLWTKVLDAQYNGEIRNGQMYFFKGDLLERSRRSLTMMRYKHHEISWLDYWVARFYLYNADIALSLSVQQKHRDEQVHIISPIVINGRVKTGIYVSVSGKLARKLEAEFKIKRDFPEAKVIEPDVPVPVPLEPLAGPIRRFAEAVSRAYKAQALAVAS